MRLGNFKKYTLLFILLPAFLFSSMGFSINSMLCYKSGNKMVSLGAMKDCCPDDQSENHSIKKNCCSFSSIDVTLNAYTAEKTTSSIEQLFTLLFTDLFSTSHHYLTAQLYNLVEKFPDPENNPPYSPYHIELKLRKLLI